MKSIMYQNHQSIILFKLYNFINSSRLASQIVLTQELDGMKVVVFFILILFV